MKNIWLILIFILAIAGCTKNEATNVAIEATPKPLVHAPPNHIATMEEWTSALMSSYKESNPKNTGDGVTEFTAEFGSKEQGDREISFARRDGFRKLRIYHAGFPTKFATGVKAVGAD